MEYLDLAIKMELDGEGFYIKQADKNRDNATVHIFNYLAQEERKHGEILRKLAKTLPTGVSPEVNLEEYQNPFEKLRDFQIDNKATPEQLDVYRLALRKEQESIDFYQDILEKTTNPQGEKIINMIILQEQYHYKIFDDMISHVLNAEEWVEDAEFGLRKPY